MQPVRIAATSADLKSATRPTSQINPSSPARIRARPEISPRRFRPNARGSRSLSPGTLGTSIIFRAAPARFSQWHSSEAPSRWIPVSSGYGGCLSFRNRSSATAPKATFEYELDRQTLNEQPHVTNVDLLVEGEDVLLCLEAKLWEQGLGSCRCGQEKSDADSADEAPELEPSSAQERAACSARILERPAYWSAGREVLGLPERIEGRPCPIAASYQAVRNVAAARALADARSPAFALFYDERNPYFSPLRRMARLARGAHRFDPGRERGQVPLMFVAEASRSGAVPTDVVEWARDKHGLVSSPSI